jgi:acetylornithine deacetylase
VEEDGKLYGLGSNDAGASLVSLIAAFIYLDKRPRDYNIVMLASCEEEVSGKDGIESVLAYVAPITIAIVGEPTEMHPAIAEKGLMVLDGKIKGVSGHAARNEGVNAIYEAVKVVEKLRDLRFEKESKMLGPVKISVTQINAGTQHNVVPDMCEIVVDVRSTDAYTNFQTLSKIRSAVPQCELTPRSTRLNPSYIDPSHPIVKRLQLLGAKPFGSPTLSDQALMPWQSLKLGPGSSSRSHTADEYIHYQEIRSAIQVYVSILDGLKLR